MFPSHDRAARDRFLRPAKEHGYVRTIIDMTCEPRVAFERVMNRTEHPNLGSKSDKKLVLKLLYDYYKKYEEPTGRECDNYNDLRTHNPYMLDLTDEIGNKPYLIVGDIHGCNKEFMQLFANCDKPDYILSCGDLVDRGPKIDRVLETFMEYKGFYSVLGNHEDKFLRYLIGNKVKITEGLQRTIDQCAAA